LANFGRSSVPPRYIIFCGDFLIIVIHIICWKLWRISGDGNEVDVKEAVGVSPTSEYVVECWLKMSC
jgi:hypothetical protein